MKWIHLGIMVLIMTGAGYLVFHHEQGVVVSDEVLECTVEAVEPPVEHVSNWGRNCTDCHQYVHDPMRDVPSDKEFNGHKNLECILCPGDYEHPQLCVSCHEGHKVITEMD